MRVILIPHDDRVACSEHEIADNDFMDTISRLGVMLDGYPETVRTSFLEQLIDRSKSPIPVAMLVDGDGHPNQKPVNHRASKFYGRQIDEIVGDVLLIGIHRDPLEGDDFVSLPDYFTLEYFRERANLLLGGH